MSEYFNSLTEMLQQPWINQQNKIKRPFLPKNREVSFTRGHL